MSILIIFELTIWEYEKFDKNVYKKWEGKLFIRYKWYKIIEFLLSHFSYFLFKWIIDISTNNPDWLLYYHHLLDLYYKLNILKL